MVRVLKIGLLTLVAGGATGGAAETLLVYTAVEPEWLSAYKTAFEKAEPPIWASIPTEDNAAAKPSTCASVRPSLQVSGSA